MSTIFKHHLSFLAIFLFLVLGCPGHLRADQRSLVSQELVKVGKMYYELGDYQRAIHELTKALMVDPTNNEAMVFLDQMGVENILYSNGKPKMLEVAEYVRGFKERIATLEEQNSKKEDQNQSMQDAINGLQNSITSTQQENEFLLSKIKEAQAQADALTAQNMSLNHNLQAKSQQEKNDLVQLNMTMTELKEKMVNNLDTIQEKEDRLAYLQEQLNNTEKDLEAVQVKYHTDIQKIEKDFDKYKQNVAKNETVKREKFNRLSEFARQKMIEAEAAKDKLLYTEYKLTDRESRIIDKSRNINQLKRDLRALQEEMARLRLQTQSTDGHSPSASEKEALIQRQEQLIEELQTKLSSAQGQMDDLENSVMDGNEEDIQGLKQQLDEKNKNLEETRSTLEAKEANYSVLEERLKDTQKRLELVEQIILEKDQQVRDLEQQISGVTQEQANDQNITNQ